MLRFYNVRFETVATYGYIRLKQVEIPLCYCDIRVTQHYFIINKYLTQKRSKATDPIAAFG
jgi:hypothetical protein